MGERMRREDDQDDNDGRRQNASDGQHPDDRSSKPSRPDWKRDSSALTKREREQRWPIG